jgi:PKD repeat protein
VTIIPSPVVSFDAPLTGCVGTPVAFTNTSGLVASSNWNFGDGSLNSLVTSPTHLFGQAGTYTVTLTVTAPNTLCTNSVTKEIIILPRPRALFTPSIMNGCVPLTVDFANTSQGAAFFNWDFGDTNTSTLATPSHTYTQAGTYDILLIGENAVGCADDTTVLNLIVYPKPNANFAVSDTTVCGIPFDVDFENTSTGATGFEWNFGNGQTSTFNEPTATYTTAGNYTATLTVSNLFTCVDTATQIIRVYPVPQASFAADPREGCDPLTVNFDNTSQNANTFVWSFGDGTDSSSIADPLHIYNGAGSYPVTLIASNDNICFDTLKINHYITVRPSPTADFSFQDMGRGLVQFENTSSNAAAYIWDFGDGDSSAVVSPNHTYAVNGPKYVILTALNSFGCLDTLRQIVSPEIFYGLAVPNALSPEAGTPEVRLFKPTGIGIKSYKIAIYSPYGQLIWQSDKLSDGQPTEFWDGTVNGKLMPQDVYVWKVEAIFDNGTRWKGMKDKTGTYKTVGTVTLLR